MMRVIEFRSTTVRSAVNTIPELPRLSFLIFVESTTRWKRPALSDFCTPFRPNDGATCFSVSSSSWFKQELPIHAELFFVESEHLSGIQIIR